jgi:hypothetical protein
LHVLHPAINLQAIQPSHSLQSPDDKRGAPSQSPDAPMDSLPQTNATPTMYIDPNLRLPAPQSQSQTSQTRQADPPAQQVISPPPPQTQTPQALGSKRQSTDGLGLLIEAFDTHHQAAGVPRPAPLPPSSAGGPGSAGPTYDPHGPLPPPAPHDYYPQPALPTNDGYENELGYYMSDGAPTTMQNWAGGGTMYGY